VLVPPDGLGEDPRDGRRVRLGVRRQPQRDRGELAELPGGPLFERRPGEGRNEPREVLEVLVRVREHPALDRVVRERGDDRADRPVPVTARHG
jgi:hypothetical protein